MKTCGQWPACRLITFRKRDNVCVILLKAYYVLSAHRLALNASHYKSLACIWKACIGIKVRKMCNVYVTHKGYINVLAFRWMQEISICSLQSYWQQGSRAFQSNKMAIAKYWLTVVPLVANPNYSLQIPNKRQIGKRRVLGRKTKM